MSYTKGKWEITNSPNILKGFLESLKAKDLNSIIYSQNEGEVAILLAGIIRRYERKNKDEANSNARLIAAAPDLLDACKRLLEPEGDVNETEKFARQAIASAESE